MYYSLAQPNHLPTTSTHNFSHQCTSPVGEIYGPRSYTCFTEVFHMWFKKFFLASPRAVMATNGGKQTGRNVVSHHFPACRPPWSVSAKTRCCTPSGRQAMIALFPSSSSLRSSSSPVYFDIAVVANVATSSSFPTCFHRHPKERPFQSWCRHTKLLGERWGLQHLVGLLRRSGHLAYANRYTLSAALCNCLTIFGLKSTSSVTQHRHYLRR